MTTHHYYYAFDAAKLLETCIEHLQDVLGLDTHSAHSEVLYGMKEAFLGTERLLQDYVFSVLKTEHMDLSQEILANLADSNDGKGTSSLPSLSASMNALKSVLQRKQLRNQQRHHNKQQPRGRPFTYGPRHLTPTADPPNTTPRLRSGFSPTRSATDTLLFRLIVALQLCLVRIDDAHYVLGGRRRPNDTMGGADANGEVAQNQRRGRSWMITLGYCSGIAGVAAYLLRRQSQREGSVDQRDIVVTLAKVSGAAVGARGVGNKWKTLWMSSKIVKSTAEIQEWQQQWLLVQYDSRSGTAKDTVAQHNSDVAKSKRLIDYAMQQTPHKSSFWISQGELRFLMVKRAMDIFYGLTPSNWQIPTTAAASASYHCLTGTDNDDSSSQHYYNHRSEKLLLPSYFRELIQNSWTLVSQPAIKNFSLQASRLLKGAAVADRIEIAGVPCFVISRHPCPELAAAIQRYHRKDRRRLQTKLATIDEQQESLPPTPFDGTVPRKLFAGSNDSFRQQDVIFHLTGGGFFAHMIAFDLLYLLDWSASTGAVVICPEFGLLPEHTFPSALQQITDVYCALTNGDSVTTLGFEVSNIVVTGESTGGNLAAALCVNLCLNATHSGTAALASAEQPEKNGAPADEEQPESPPLGCAAAPSQPISEEGELVPGDEQCLYPDSSGSDEQHEETSSCRSREIRLPDAMMLSCAVLDLSLELSHSRVVATDDPVLPSGVIKAISDAYLPPSLGISKKHLLASPFFAPDSILSKFPTTLLFASSNDPLLDDSVDFNQRLRSMGVNSELRAVHNMPHAYWGLGTAGFPEAKQVQKECREWLAHQLSRDKDWSTTTATAGAESKQS